jgi:YegS/Rv2252/BmrU family lipid kinase
MKITLILNPISGKKDHPEQLKLVLELLGSAGMYPDIRETRRRGDAHQFAKEAVEEGYEIVIAAGGDGTVNEVANGLVGSAVKLAIIPLGTANVLALETGIPLDPVAAASIIVQGRSQSITLGHITYCDPAQKDTRDNHFLMMAGIGFDGGVLKEIKREHITRLGKLAYVTTALNLLFQYKSPPLAISVDREKKFRGYGVIASNGKYYGGKFRVAPKAEITDSFLDLCIIKRKGVRCLIKTALKVFMGTHPSGDDIHYCKAKTIEIDSPDQVYVQADGEFLGTVPVCLTAREKALSVIVPETNSE